MPDTIPPEALQQLVEMQMSPDPALRQRASAIARKLTPDEGRAFYEFQKQMNAPPSRTTSVLGIPITAVGERPRPDSNVIGVGAPGTAGIGLAPEDFALIGQGIGAIRGAYAAAVEAGAGTSGITRAVIGAASKMTWPAVKFHVAHSMLRSAGISEPFASWGAAIVGARGGGGGPAAAETTTKAAASAAEDIGSGRYMGASDIVNQLNTMSPAERAATMAARGENVVPLPRLSRPTGGPRPVPTPEPVPPTGPPMPPAAPTPAPAAPPAAPPPVAPPVEPPPPVAAAPAAAAPRKFQFNPELGPVSPATDVPPTPPGPLPPHANPTWHLNPENELSIQRIRQKMPTQLTAAELQRGRELIAAGKAPNEAVAIIAQERGVKPVNVVEPVVSPSAAPKLVDPDWASSPARMRAELGAQARLLGMKGKTFLEEGELQAGLRQMKKGVRPDVVARQIAEKRMQTTATGPAPTSLAPEAQQLFDKLVASGKSEAEAMRAVQASMALQERFGSGTLGSISEHDPASTESLVDMANRAAAGRAK